MPLSILSLTTTPTFSFFRLMALVRPCRAEALPHMRGRSGLLLLQQRLHPREIASHAPHLQRRIELSHRLLDSKPEQLVVEVVLARAQILEAQLPQLRGPLAHNARSSAKRIAKRVLMGSLAAASSMARRASVSVTPSISNMTRPGRTTHTHCSGAPLPLPIRVSCGFLVIGLAGPPRTPISPPRLMKRVIATRPASICRSVSQHGSIALSP